MLPHHQTDTGIFLSTSQVTAEGDERLYADMSNGDSMTTSAYSLFPDNPFFISQRGQEPSALIRSSQLTDMHTDRQSL